MHKLVIWNPAVTRNTWFFRTLGPYSITSWLRQAGVKAQVIDWVDRWDINELVEATSKLVKQNGYVGLSTTFWKDQEPKAIKDARLLLKQLRPDIKWMIGGARHYVAKPEDYDVIVKGFGEDEVIKILNHGIGPIWHPSLEQEQFHEGDAILPNEVLPMSLGRGCRFKCKFCSYPLIGRKPGTYERSLDNLMLDYNSRKLLGASSAVALVDDTINESDERLSLLEHIKSTDSDFGWGGYMRADLIWSHKDQIKRLPKSGLLTTFHGIETLHPQASKAIGKGWSGKHAKEWLPQLYDDMWGNQITTAISFIVGLPGETLQDNRNTHQWMIDSFTTSMWRFCSLTIARDSRDWPSEFDLSAEQYGYRFPRPEQPNFWENNIMNVKDAFDLETELNADPRASEKSFVATGYFWALNMGASKEELNHIGQTSERFNELLADQDVKLRQYITKFKQFWGL